MRNLSLVAIVFVALRLGSARAEDDDFDDDLSDLDLDDQEADGSAAGGGAPQGMGQAEPVEDFDLGMPQEDRKKRMSACFGYTLGRLQSKQEEMTEMVKGIMEHHKMKQDQAMNSLLMTWMMSCYMNVEEDAVKSASGKSLGTPMPLSEEEDSEMFAHQKQGAPQTVQQASQAQWGLLESILKEHQLKNPQGAQGPRGQPQMAAPGSSMDSQTGMIYVLVVFGVLFGAGVIAVSKLTQMANGKDKDRSGRSQKKKESAERKMAKKRM